MKKIELELTLEGVEVFHKIGKSQHILAASLIYPRSGIARRISEKLLTLSGGKEAWSGKSWCSRVLFKEQVEGNFGLSVEIYESLTKAKLKALGRYVLGGALRLGSGAVEDNVPLVGDYLALPLDYHGKNLQKVNNENVVWVKGDVDLSADGMTSGEIKVPLVALADVTRQVKRKVAGGRTEVVRHQVVLP